MMNILPELKIENESAADAETGRGVKSFRFDFKKGDFVTEDGKTEIVTKKEKLKVWIEKLIRTELNKFPVYEGTTYGVAFPWNVIGMRDRDYIRVEISGELRKKLLENSEITDVRKIEIEFSPKAVHISVIIVTVYDREDIKFEYYY